MGKKKTPSLPNTPQFQADPYLQQSQQQLSGLGNRLTNFDFSGNLSPLQDTINMDPEITNLALSMSQNSLNPAFSRNRQNSVNDLANLGALESSTTSNAFAQQDYDLNSQLQAITSGAALEDRQRALQNRMSLFGTGLQTLQSVGQTGLSNQSQQNSFNLDNYQNQVAKTLGEQKSSVGGFMGGLTGAAGGALAGFGLGGPIGAIAGGLGGGLVGGFGQPGTGGSVLQAGAGIAGSTSGFKLPGQSARNSGGNGIDIDKIIAQLGR